MFAKEYIKLINAVTSETVADIINNTQCDTLSLNVSGAATSIDIKVEANNVFGSTEYQQIAAIKLSDFSVNKTITSAGLYEIPIETAANIRVSVTAVSGGAVTVDARLVNTGV